MSNITLICRDVSHRLSPRFTLTVPSLRIEPGITAVLGGNGSGKTTLLRLLSTVCAPQRGSIESLDGRSIHDGDHQVGFRRQLGYLPQDDSVPHRLTVFDHVDLVAVTRELGSTTRERRAMVSQSLAAMDLLDVASERCGRLSGGQRRRVALAAALVGGAGVLVLDEPDAHLDDEHRDALGTWLRGHAHRSTIVVATHDRGWVDSIADHHITVTDGFTAG